MFTRVLIRVSYFGALLISGGVLAGGVAAASPDSPSGSGDCIALISAIGCGGSYISITSPAASPTQSSPASGSYSRALPSKAPAGVGGLTSRTPAPVHTTYFAAPYFGTTPSGQACFMYIALPATSQLPAAMSPSGTQLGPWLSANMPHCPANTPAAASPAAAPAPPAPPPVSPVVLAQRFFSTIPLPVPRPSIPPGSAITGLPAYLVTDGNLDPVAYREHTPLGELLVTAHGSYEVNWGDGTVSGPYATEGRPYPNGIITHTYDNVGKYTVTVTVSWTATWTLGAMGGTLGGLRTVGTIRGFPVGQEQAIITG